MSTHSPRRLTELQRRARQTRVVKLARKLGFAGSTEYRHVYSQSGGAQYGQGVTAEDDLLTVYAEAFERDRDPKDFSLEAIVAHERGHQLLARHPKISRLIAGRISAATEEILASLLGAMISASESDRDALVAKATGELLKYGEPRDIVIRRLRELWELLEEIL